MSGTRVGTSGWSYPGGRGTWNGVFYPVGAGGRRRIDELTYYARFFDTVEVNATFYRPPVAAVTRRWLARTPSSFDFSVKLYQKFTHPAMFTEATGASDTAVGRRDVDEFLSGIDPLRHAGRLGAILAQFPPAFTAAPATLDYLERLLRAFHDCPVAVELRHRSWSDRANETWTLLNGFGAAWVQIDEPKFRFSIRQQAQPTAQSFHYFRLHGRNREQWWQHERAEDRYNYLYSADELGPMAAAVREADRQAGKAFIYLNNHFAAKAVVNATMLKRLLGLPVTEGYPLSLVERYPELNGLVVTAPSLP